MSIPKIQILVGKCPRCGSTTEAAPDPVQPGLEGLFCAQGHGSTQYEVYDTFYMTRAELAADD